MSLEESHGDYVPDEVLLTVDETPNTGEHQVIPRRMWQGERSDTPAQTITRGQRSDSTETVLLQPVSPNTQYEEEPSETHPGRNEESSEYETRDVQDMSSGAYEATAPDVYERHLGAVYGGDQLARNSPVKPKKVDPISLTNMIVAGLDDRLRESLRPIEIQCGELIQGLGMIGKDVIQLTTDIKLQKIKTDAMMNSLTPQGQGNKKQSGEKASKKLFQPKLWQTPGVVTGKATTANHLSADNVRHIETHPAKEDENRGNGESNSETTTKLESQNGKLRSLLVRATSLGKSRKTKIAQLQSQVANSTAWTQNKEKDIDNTGEVPRRTVLPPSSSAFPTIKSQVGLQPEKKAAGSETVRKSNRLKKGKVTRTKGLILTDDRTASLTFEGFAKQPPIATIMHCQSMEKAWKLLQRLPLHKKDFDFVIICLGDWDAGSYPKKKWGPACLAALKAAIGVSVKNSPIIVSQPVGRPGIDEEYFPIDDYCRTTAAAMSGCKGSIFLLQHEEIRRQLKNKMTKKEADVAIEEEIHKTLDKMAQ